jgi:hypothetical protein
MLDLLNDDRRFKSCVFHKDAGIGKDHLQVIPIIFLILLNSPITLRSIWDPQHTGRSLRRRIADKQVGLVI